MITIHSATADDFSTLGIGALSPTEAVVEEHAGAMYQLTMTHPLDERGRWRHLVKYNIIKAPSPTRETPEIAISGSSAQTVTRHIYKVATPKGGRLHLRQQPSLLAKIITKYRPGTEVVRVSRSGDWARVVVCSGGAAGYMWADYLTYVRTETETIGTDAPGKVILPRQTREQLFRISKAEKDDAAGLVRVTALHISFDLAYNAIVGEMKLENVPADEAVARILAQACDEHPFSVYCTDTAAVSGDFTGKSVAAALWGDGGVLAQTGGRLVRDNYDIFILADEERDLGVEIRHGKNLTGAIATEDVSGTVTRIIPIGKDQAGNMLMLENPVYVESPRASLVPVVRSKTVEYNVQVGLNGVEDAISAQGRLIELALADFEAGADGAVVGLDVDFVQLENTQEYAQYADLQSIHMYDTVHVISARSGIRSAVRMTGFRADARARKPRYIEVMLGVITDYQTTVFGYDIADGTVSGTKVLPGSIDGGAIANGALDYVKLNKAAVDLLAADALHAVEANIDTLVAGKLTADSLAAGSITTEKLASGSVTADKMAAGVLSADLIAAGSITADKIASKTITAAQLAAGLITADSGLIAVGAIQTAQIADGSITSAKIVELNADLIKTGTLSVERLLIVGDDGLIYRINATSAGLTASELSKEQYRNYINGSVIVAKSITAAQIAAQTITANEIAANTITAAQINVSSLVADQTFINEINALAGSLDLKANESVNIMIGTATGPLERDVADAKNNASAALDAAGSALESADSAQAAAQAASAAAGNAQSAADGAKSDASAALDAAGAAIENAYSAQSAAAAANTAAGNAQSAADAAQSAANDAKNDASAALNTAGTAVESANSAQSAADAANTAAGNAQSAADAAGMAASNAQATADRAGDAASNANSMAMGAVSSAQEAGANASQAQQTANAANANASQAQQSANAAQETADAANGKADATDAKLAMWFRFDEDGLETSKRGSTYSTLVDDTGFHIQQLGERIGSFAKRQLAAEAVRVGKVNTAERRIVMREAADGGIVFNREGAAT